MTASGRGDVAIFNGHPVTSLFEQTLLIGPDERQGDVEAVDASVHRLDKAREPGLERLALPAFLAPNPVGELRDDDCARVAAILLDRKSVV